MKFSVSLSDFQKGLQSVMPALPQKSTLPVLEHLHFSIADGNLKMIATDQDITIIANLSVTDSEQGSILVPGRKLSEIVKALGNDDNLVFSTNDSNFEIGITTTTGTYNMKGLNSDEYLDLPELFESQSSDSSNDSKNITFDSKDLSRLATQTSFAVSVDEFRPAMTGVLFQFRGNYINAVATDSYRLVKSMLHSESEIYPQDTDIIIPAKSIEQLKKIDSKEVTMSQIESMGKTTHLRFEMGDIIFITRIIDEKFPPYESVIPSNNNLIATVDKSQILAGIKRVSIFASTMSRQIKLHLENDKLTLKGSDDDLGSQAQEVINCAYQGDNIEIGFNYNYLQQAIQNTEPVNENNIYLTFSESTKPALIKQEEEGRDLLMLIMPVRLA